MNNLAATAAANNFTKAFAKGVLALLVLFVFFLDALPAIGERLGTSIDPSRGPIASLFHLAFDHFWPGTILLHAGAATLWLACGPWRFSLRLLSVILSMSARAAWVWFLYGIEEPQAMHFGEPFKVSGIPILFSIIIFLTSLGFRRGRLILGKDSSPKRHSLQIVDLIAWTAAVAFLLAPALRFIKVLSKSVLEDRLIYDSPVVLAWASLTWFSAILVREWLVESPFPRRLLRLSVIFAAVCLVSMLLILGARLINEIGPQDMAFNILPYFLPSTVVWCMATGWALREIGVRMVSKERRQSATLKSPTQRH